ncbi:MAG: hypothetical protein [Bacteriophage sp.]|nr:MAG: hypothetical protein [Bacteriophage sp.]
MAANEVLRFEGKSIVTFFRLLKNAAKEAATLLPGQTSAEFGPQRDSDSTVTKDGSFQTSSSLETDLEVDFINNTSVIADQFYDSVLNNEKMEIWLVNTARKNAAGQYFAWYMQGTVSEDDNSNDADDISERDVSFSITGIPQRGWLDLSQDQQEQIDYVFRGLKPVTTDSSGKETTGGAAWAATDAGVNVPNPTAQSNNTNK